ncbi:MAG: diaminopimelate epimerase [Pirellulaceae bacterium]|nr:diaminopimelate epimerase [Pirellulaceae bacterium]
MNLEFTKMHGAGNDYIYVNCFEPNEIENPAELAIEVSNRNTGIGGDGLILIKPSSTADAAMEMYNADGSRAEMCGNGIRCVAKYVFDHGIAKRDSLEIETDNGVLSVDLTVEGDLVSHVRVDLGEPILEASQIPTTLTGSQVVDHEIQIDDRTFQATCVSMGNPHCVIFVDHLDDALVQYYGPLLENHSWFPNRVNVEFVEVLDRRTLRQRTWERGSGETLACGTGAGAVCVAGVLTKRTDASVKIHLLGGDLELEWRQSDNHVYKTGPAREVFSGIWKN